MEIITASLPMFKNTIILVVTRLSVSLPTGDLIWKPLSDCYLREGQIRMRHPCQCLYFSLLSRLLIRQQLRFCCKKELTHQPNYQRRYFNLVINNSVIKN